MILETLFYTEILCPICTKKFRDHAASLPGPAANRAIGLVGTSAN
jgi:hypothetical protein